MPPEPSSDNLYAPPADPQLAPPSPSGTEPKHLNTVLILSLVFAIMGALGGLMGVFSAITGLGTNAPPTQPGMPPEFIEAQAKLYEEMREAAMQGPAAVIALIGIGLESFAIFATISARRREERGRALLVNTVFPMLMAFTILKMVWTMFITTRTFAVMDRFMERVTASMASSGGAEAGRVMNTAMLAGVVGGALFALAWAGGLTWFYNWGRKVLKEDAARQHFS